MTSLSRPINNYEFTPENYNAFWKLYTLAFEYINAKENPIDYVKFAENARLLNIATTFIDEYDNRIFKVQMHKAKNLEYKRTYAQVVST